MLFRVDLRTSSLAIGYAVLISRSVMFLYNTVSMVPIIMVIKELGHSIDSRNAYYLKTVAIIFFVEIFVSLMDIISTITLIIGLHKNNRKLVHVFLQTAAIFFIVGVILVLFGVCISAKKYTDSDWFRLAFEIVYKCIFVYCVHVIRSYYTMMRKREEGFCAYDNFVEIIDMKPA